MAKVVGIGGVFLRARNVDALRAWYVEALGIEFDGDNGVRFDQVGDNAGLVFNLFPHSSTYIGDPERESAMVNFLVRDLGGMVERLAELGVLTEPIDDEPYGNFSWAIDPEGNHFELWEPPSN